MIRALLRRLRISFLVLRSDPSVVFRIPRFVWLTIVEGPNASLKRLRQITHPERFSFDYETWLAQHHTPTSEEREAMQAWAETLQDPPRIAVLMPVYNPRPEWLQAAINSVLGQLYPHWEFCIADDCSSDPEIRPLLEAAMAADSRVKVVFRAENGHISANSNSALALVSAPWIALLDHDDLLSTDALVWVARAILDYPRARLLYSDEDKLAVDGRRFGPYLKSDWNPILMEGHNMFSHLGIYSTALAREVGGFRKGFEGSQDYDLVLRCSEMVDREQIVHIPRILYHWRVHNQSTASGPVAKPYAQVAMERALEEHCLRQALPLAKLHVLPQGQRVQLDLPLPLPLVSVVIPTRNGLKVLRPCLDSLVNLTTYSCFEVLVVDNGSDDPKTLSYLEKMQDRGQIRVIRDEQRPFNYSALNNAAVQQAGGELICLMNNDVEVIQPAWLDELVSQLQRPNVALAGAKLLYPDYTVQHCGVVLGMGGVAGHGHRCIRANEPGYFNLALLAQELSAVTAACLLVRRSVWQQLGGLDAEHLAVAFNDVDFCMRVREAGYRIIFTPFSKLLHHESVSRGSDFLPEHLERFEREVAYMHQRWGQKLLNDPYYNPNLTLNAFDYSLARPPRHRRWPLR